MKKLILTALATSFAIKLFAQGTVIFNNDVPSVLRTHVYAPFPGNPFLSQIGNGPNDITPGIMNWSGFTPLAGPTFLSQLLGAPGYNAPESQLLPGSPVTSFRTGSAAGLILGAAATFNNIPANAPQATLEMVAWDNASGLYPTWSQASVAWLNGLIAAGNSGTWNQSNLGEGNIGPLMHNTADPTQRVHSFNLYFVPEPTTAALAGMGAAALLILRRRR